MEDVLVGMDPRKSLKIYPRIDNIFKTKSSFNYDMMRTRIFEERSNKNETIVIWFTHGLIGVFIGFVAFLMAVVEDEIVASDTAEVEDGVLADVCASPCSRSGMGQARWQDTNTKSHNAPPRIACHAEATMCH